MPAGSAYQQLPFAEQIEFFLGKLNIPTETWHDLLDGQHNWAFTVAGATRDDVLADFRDAVDRAIEDGTTYQEFLRDFDSIVERYGWSYHGGRDWRARLIYSQNLYSSYAAGRLEQLRQFPYWQYRHSHAVVEPRPEHVEWDGLILRADDPWWETHFPPGGYGCQCTVRGFTQGDIDRRGLQVDTAPEVEMETHVVGATSDRPRVVTVPRGITPGFDHLPGRPITPVLDGRPATGLPSDAKPPRARKLPEVVATDPWQALSEAAGDLRGSGYVLSSTAERIPIAAEMLDAGATVAAAAMIGDTLRAPAEVWVEVTPDGVVKRYIKRYSKNGAMVVELRRGTWAYVHVSDAAPYRHGERVWP